MRLGSTLIYRLIRSTSSHHRPWQIAMAVTAGLLLGILPKTSLLIALVGLICFMLPAHLPLLAVTSIMISLATPLLESLLGRLGLWSLMHPSLSAYWMLLDGFPLIPWLGLHNTVVNGSLVAWCVASVPVYFAVLAVSKILIDPEIPEQVFEILMAAEYSPPAGAPLQALEIRPLSGVREPGPARAPIAPPVVIWDDINHDQSYFDLDIEEADAESAAMSSGHVIRRAADVAAWAEELITEELLMDDRSAKLDRESILKPISDPSSEVESDDQERWLIETTIEMVRIAEQAVTNQAALKSKQSGDEQNVAKGASPTQESFEIQSVQSQNTELKSVDQTVLPGASIRREQLPHSEHRSHLGDNHLGVAGDTTYSVADRPREEALHYLLRHLKGVQEKAQKQ